MRSKALNSQISIFTLVYKDNRLGLKPGSLNRMIKGMFGKE